MMPVIRIIQWTPGLGTYRKAFGEEVFASDHPPGLGMGQTSEENKGQDILRLLEQSSDVPFCQWDNVELQFILDPRRGFALVAYFDLYQLLMVGQAEVYDFRLARRS